MIMIYIYIYIYISFLPLNFPGGSDSKGRSGFDPWEDPLEKGMATHSSILAWRIPWTRGAWQATVHGVTKSQRNCLTLIPVRPKGSRRENYYQISVRNVG